MMTNIDMKYQNIQIISHEKPNILQILTWKTKTFIHFHLRNRNVALIKPRFGLNPKISTPLNQNLDN